jgi:gliding motility associated protien GldN
MMKNLIVSVILMFGLTAYGQREDINGGPINSRTQTGIIDGVYLSTHVPTKRLIPYEHVREADVIWSKRVWRTIDLREKMNHSVYYPHDTYDSEGKWVRNSSRWSLWTVIRHHIFTGDLIVYSPYNPAQFTLRDGDEFKYPILPQPGLDYKTDSVYRDELLFYLGKLGADSDIPLVDMYGEDSLDINGNYVYPPRDTVWFKSEDIVQYRLKEDWFFDKERSVLDVRIIGLAPVYYKTDDDGNIMGAEELFWLYFPTDCRYVFNNYFVYNEKNDAQWMSFDDWFWKRRFTSFIHKESNVFDRQIDKYRVGVDALMESRRITEEIRLIEHDVWSF